VFDPERSITMDGHQNPEDLAEVLATSTRYALVSEEGSSPVPRHEDRSGSRSPARNGTGVKARPQPELVLGPDVSHYQGEAIQWDKVASAPYVKFAFCKATEGLTYVDSSFARNWAAIKNTSLLRGAYHFGHPKNKPQDEVDHFLSTVGDDAEADLLALNLEVSDEQSPEHILEWATTFLSYLDQSTTTRVIVYTGGFWKYQLGNPASAAIGKFPLWLAQYSNMPGPPKPWSQWAFWQYTNGTYGPSGRLPKSIAGVGACDVSQFNGSYKDLQDLVARAAPRPSALPWPGRYLKLSAPRMKGPDVFAWQQRMKERGWSLTVDGSYGPETRGVTLGLQKHMKIEVDGIVGPTAWAAAWA
jgi:lysozyme